MGSAEESMLGMLVGKEEHKEWSQKSHFQPSKFIFSYLHVVIHGFCPASHNKEQRD